MDLRWKRVSPSMAVQALIDGKKVRADLPESKYPMCPVARRVDYNPKTDYSINRTYLKSADWYVWEGDS